MSKERLEEIVEKISEQTFDRIIVPQTKITIEYQDIKYLLNTIEEQVEQNKRYREAIDKIKGELYKMSAWGKEEISMLDIIYDLEGEE